MASHTQHTRMEARVWIGEGLRGWSLPNEATLELVPLNRAPIPKLGFWPKMAATLWQHIAISWHCTKRVFSSANATSWRIQSHVVTIQNIQILKLITYQKNTCKLDVTSYRANHINIMSLCTCVYYHFFLTSGIKSIVSFSDRRDVVPHIRVG